MWNYLHRRTTVALSLALLLAMGSGVAVLAGPPLICHSIEIGDAASLPWGKHWREARSDYNIKNLVRDTEALLGPKVPVLVRMETIRRATLYSTRDLGVAAQLFSVMKSRAASAEAASRGDALPLFDLGYLVEVYRQASRETRGVVSSSGIDGYALVARALELRGGDAEMEFAAALITAEPSRATHAEHFRRAVDGAARNSLLALNLVSHFNHRGKNVAELRAYASNGQN